MDQKNKSLFDIVGEGDDLTLQRLLLEGKEERNVATLAVSAKILYQTHVMDVSSASHLVDQCFNRVYFFVWFNII